MVCCTNLKFCIQDGTGELIYYERPDVEGPKLSNYSKSMVIDLTSLKTVLQMALGAIGTVKKTRMLSHFNQTRIHVDEVVGLGNFLELEVSLLAMVLLWCYR